MNTPVCDYTTWSPRASDHHDGPYFFARPTQSGLGISIWSGKLLPAQMCVQVYTVNELQPLSARGGGGGEGGHVGNTG